MPRPDSPGVQLPNGVSASGLFHRVLLQARERFDAFRDVDVPEDPKAFRADFPSIVPRFECARIASEDRSAIARRMALEAASAIVHRDPSGADRPLAEFVAESDAQPLALETIVGTSTDDMKVSIPCDDELFGLERAPVLVDRLEQGHDLTPRAAQALRWALDRARDGLDLSGRKFVVLGAAAELAPTPILLAAGADVLWIDVDNPPSDPSTFRGKLHYARGGSNLLTQTRQIVATIEAFAGDDTVSVGMFAYAAGGGREWRLEAAMNAITQALPRGRVDGVGLYISPTSAAQVVREDVVESQRRRAAAPLWQRALAKTGALGAPMEQRGEVHVARALVPLQGASYQAAQYLAKVLAAEAFATSRRVGPVSANVAGITNTGSMSLSVFQAAFIGAKLFGVRIFAPETTRWLCGLLLVHDLLNRDVPTLDDPADLFARQIHGGVYTLPFATNDAIKFAAMYGLTRRPKLLAAAVRGK